MRRFSRSNVLARTVFSLSVAVMAISATMPSAYAKDESDSSNKLGASSKDKDALPECLQKLNLTKEQKSQAQDITRKYDTKIDETWKEFGDRYMETVRTEVDMLAAVEDNLSESQRATARKERHRIAHMERKARRQADKDQSATSKDNTSSKDNKSADQSNGNKPESVDVAVIGNHGVVLTIEQEDLADRIHHKYVHRLRSLNRDIHVLHAQLVSLEADKLVELEKILTREQLDQLHKDRHSVSTAHGDSTNKDSTITK